MIDEFSYLRLVKAAARMESLDAYCMRLALHHYRNGIPAYVAAGNIKLHLLRDAPAGNA